MSDALIRTLVPQLQPAARAFVGLLRNAGLGVVVASARRSAAKQRKLREKFLRGESAYPAAPPGHSGHELGIAFDLTLTPPAYEAAGRLWESWGGRWGGRFNDPVHFDVH